MARKPQKKRRRKPPVQSPLDSPRKPSRAPRPTRDAEPLVLLSAGEALRRYGWLIAAFVAVTLYTYWPTLVWIEDAWRNEPDYSHGYLVLPLAGLLCWHRRESFPGVRDRASWAGVSLILAALAMRVLGRLVYADFLDAWSLLPLLLGSIWVLFGSRAMRWSLPAVGFLLLMMPLPYRAESLLSWKLQGVATELSTILLRVFGEPAVSEGHVIWIEDQRLLVEQACSGMRIFIGVAALAYFWAATITRSWVDRAVLAAVTIPLAVLVNALRITAVGFLNQWFDDSASQHTIHDWSGYLMIPLAFVILWMVKAYWQHAYRPVGQLSAKDFVPTS